MSIELTQNTSPTKQDLSQIKIGPLDSAVSRAAFCCGNTRIDNFFRNNARQQHASNRVRVYVASFGATPVGYYYLVAASNVPGDVSKEAIEKFGRVNSTPCVYLGMLGVHEGFQGIGLGQMLMLHAMGQALKVADLVGLYALTLDALDEKIALLYERWGFKRFDTNGLAMYIALSTIRQLFREPS